LYQSVLLAEAGFPFAGDAFTLEYWSDMGQIKMLLKQHVNAF
jgi:hypothetical protein